MTNNYRPEISDVELATWITKEKPKVTEAIRTTRTTKPTTVLSTTTVKEVDDYNQTEVQKAAIIARKIVSSAGWAVISSGSSKTSRHKPPISFLTSVSDKPDNSRTGVPYFLLTKSKWSVAEIAGNGSREVIALVPRPAGCDCYKQILPLKDYRPIHVLLIGCLEAIDTSTVENGENVLKYFPRQSLYPHLDSMESYFYSKLKIKKIFLYYEKEGPIYIPSSEYQAVDLDGTEDYDYNFGSISVVNKELLLFAVVSCFLKFFRLKELL